MEFEMEPVKDIPLISARESWRPTRWAVIGASGFVGTNVVHHLQSEGFDVLQLPAPRVSWEVKADPVQQLMGLSKNHPAVPLLAEQLENIDVVINAAGMAAPGGVGDKQIYGANSLLPGIISFACEQAGISHLIHLSSAAVQGRRPTLDSSTSVSPFSHYSYSKALGERLILAIKNSGINLDASIVRATSVQGSGRPTTEKLQSLARSPFASVAFPGTQPSAVSSITALCEFIQLVGNYKREMAVIQLQPWEGLSVRDVLALAGGKEPRVVPRFICRLVIESGHIFGRIVPKIAGKIRRVEMTWFGQGAEFTTHQVAYAPDPKYIREILEEGLSHK